MTSKQNILSLAAASLIAMSAFTGLASAANGIAPTVAVASSQTDTSGGGFFARLFGASSDVREQKVSYDPHYGSADYICSPSGFGVRSHCSRRTR